MPDNSATRGVISSIFSGMFNLGYVVCYNLQTTITIFIDSHLQEFLIRIIFVAVKVQYKSRGTPIYRKIIRR